MTMTMHPLLSLLIISILSFLAHAQHPENAATGALITTISTAGFVITEYYTTISTVTYTLNQLLLGSSTSCPPGFVGGFQGPGPTFVPACLFCPSGFWFDRTDCQPYNYDSSAYVRASFTPTPTLGGAASTFVYGGPVIVSETFTNVGSATTMTTSVTATLGGPYSLVMYSAIVPSVSGYAIHMPDLAFYPDTTIVTGGFSVSIRQQLSSLTIAYGGPATTVGTVVEYSVNLPSFGYFLAPVPTTTPDEGGTGGVGAQTSSLVASSSTSPAESTSSSGSAVGLSSQDSSLVTSTSTTSAQTSVASSGSGATTGTMVAPNQGSAASLGLSSLAVSGLLGCVGVCLVLAL